MNSKIQNKINYLSELKNKISLWSDKAEEELAYLIKEFEKITRAEVSSYFFPYFKDDSFAEILVEIASKYSENKKITLNIISSLCNMVLRYDLHETKAIYNFVLENANKKNLAGYVSIYLPNLKGFKAYPNKWQYFVSLKKMSPKKIAHQNLVKIIERNIDDIPSKYKQEIMDFLQEKYEMANNEGGKKYYQDMINRINFNF